MSTRYSILKKKKSKPVKAGAGEYVQAGISLIDQYSNSQAKTYDTVGDSRNNDLEQKPISNREDEIDKLLKKRNAKSDAELAKEDDLKSDYWSWDNIVDSGFDPVSMTTDSIGDNMENNNTDIDSYGNRTYDKNSYAWNTMSDNISEYTAMGTSAGGWIGAIAGSVVGTGVGLYDMLTNNDDNEKAYEKKYAQNVRLTKQKQDALTSRKATTDYSNTSETMARNGMKTMILKPKKAKGGTNTSNYGSNRTNKNQSYLDLGISTASDLANNYYANQDVNYDSYGSVAPDRNTTIKNSTSSTALSGGSAGYSLGNSLDVENGGLYGAAAGVVLGGITGYFDGKNKADDEEEAYQKELDYNTLKNKRAFDIKASQWAMTAKRGTKLGGFILKKKVKSKALIMKTGGRLEVPGEVNVVVKGKLHKENNNLGNKDKGVPIIDNDGVKTYEVEAGEVIFRLDTTQLIERYAKEYSQTDDDNLLIELGKILTLELLNNTQDNYGKFDIETAKNEN